MFDDLLGCDTLKHIHLSKQIHGKEAYIGGVGWQLNLKCKRRRR